MASPKRKPFRRAALIVSVLFHIGLVVVLAFWYVNRERRPAEEPVARQSEPSVPSAAPQPEPPRPSPEVTSEQVNNTLDRTLEVYEEKSTEEQLSLLEEKATDLEGLASEESIDEIAAKFREWTNIKPRASAPAAEPVAGTFDFDTAQLHEVRKVDSEEGQVQYHGVLVDAEGRTFDIEMTEAEGETAYQTLQTLSRFPLADRVYRQIAMPLIDQAAAAAKSNRPTDPEASDTEDEVDDRDPFDGQLDEEPPVEEEPDQEVESDTSVR